MPPPPPRFGLVSSEDRRPWSAPRRMLVVVLASVALVFVAPPGSDAHVRYEGGCDVYGYCELFYGTTHSDPFGSPPVDPINVVFWPYGWYEFNIMHWEWSWRDQDCNSDLWNYRQLSNNQWYWGTQDGWRASAGCFGGRWHARGFRGHEHYGSALDSNNWSVSDVHHESWAHNIDRSWQEAEEEARLNAYYQGHPTTPNWTYLPRGNGCFQGYCYNGWPAQINPRPL
jgi:hypothetical protein